MPLANFLTQDRLEYKSRTSFVHEPMNRLKLPQRLQGNEWWAKCDCLTTVAFFRLDRCFVGKCPHTGKRQYEAPTITSEDLEGIKTAITKHLAIAVLISP